jgi:hypothetical protein
VQIFVLPKSSSHWVYNNRWVGLLCRYSYIYTLLCTHITFSLSPWMWILQGCIKKGMQKNLISTANLYSIGIMSRFYKKGKTIIQFYRLTTHLARNKTPKLHYLFHTPGCITFYTVLTEGKSQRSC